MTKRTMIKQMDMYIQRRLKCISRLNDLIEQWQTVPSVWCRHYERLTYKIDRKLL